jgi:hypothetical protein
MVQKVDLEMGGGGKLQKEFCFTTFFSFTHVQFGKTIKKHFLNIIFKIAPLLYRDCPNLGLLGTIFGQENFPFCLQITRCGKCSFHFNWFVDQHKNVPTASCDFCLLCTYVCTYLTLKSVNY